MLWDYSIKRNLYQSYPCNSVIGSPLIRSWSVVLNIKLLRGKRKNATTAAAVTTTSSFLSLPLSLFSFPLLSSLARLLYFFGTGTSWILWRKKWKIRVVTCHVQSTSLSQLWQLSMSWPTWHTWPFCLLKSSCTPMLWPWYVLPACPDFCHLCSFYIQELPQFCDRGDGESDPGYAPGDLHLHPHCDHYLRFSQCCLYLNHLTWRNWGVQCSSCGRCNRLSRWGQRQACLPFLVFARSSRWHCLFEWPSQADVRVDVSEHAWYSQILRVVHFAKGT